MKFTERKQFTYDPQRAALSDTVTALGIYDEYVTRFTPRPMPKIFEVKRDPTLIDPLWHMPTTLNTQIDRTLEIPCINMFEKPDWRLTLIGRVAQRRDTFTFSNLGLQRADYFPLQGDMMWWNGYRYIMTEVNLNPEAYWQQTGVWMGLVVTAQVMVLGDAVPSVDLAVPTPAETASSGALPVTSPSPWPTG